MNIQITKRVCCLLTIVFLVHFVVAADVAYVVKNENKVDKGFLEAFDEMGLMVDIIENDEIMDTSFSQYKVVFIGDGTISHVMHMSKNLPIVLTNGKYAAWFGFLKNGVVRYMSANTELKIKSDGRTIKAYTSDSYGIDGPGLSYVFLPNRNKQDDVRVVATTSTGRDNEIGAVIGYLNGNANKCFFGVNKPQFWTSSETSLQSRELFENCVNFVMNEDDNGNGDGGDGDGEEQVHDVSIDKTYTNSVNGIRIHDEESDAYLLEETAQLTCNKKYKIDFRTINNGDFNETINFSGNLGAVFNWSAKKTDLEPGKTTTTGSKTINMTFAVGDYDLTVEAIIPFIDATPSDNMMTRKVSIVC